MEKSYTAFSMFSKAPFFNKERKYVLWVDDDETVGGYPSLWITTDEKFIEKIEREAV